MIPRKSLDYAPFWLKKYDKPSTNLKKYDEPLEQTTEAAHHHDNRTITSLIRSKLLGNIAEDNRTPWLQTILKTTTQKISFYPYRHSPSHHLINDYHESYTTSIIQNTFTNDTPTLHSHYTTGSIDFESGILDLKEEVMLRTLYLSTWGTLLCPHCFYLAHVTHMLHFLFPIITHDDPICFSFPFHLWSNMPLAWFRTSYDRHASYMHCLFHMLSTLCLPCLYHEDSSTYTWSLHSCNLTSH